MKTIFLFLIFLILGTFLPTIGATQEDMSFSEMVAKRQALQAEQNALGQQWQKNQDSLDKLEVQYETLEEQITDGKVRLGPLKEEAEILIRDFERKLPKLKEQEASLVVNKHDLGQEYNRYSAHCNFTVEEEEYAQRAAECDAWYSRYSSAWKKLEEDFNQFNRKSQTLVAPRNRAIEVRDTLDSEIKEMEAQQLSLADEGVPLEAENKEFVQKGLELLHQIQELDLLIIEQPESPCKPGKGKLKTAEAFEECMRTIFEGGSGTGVPPPPSPFDVYLKEHPDG